MDNLIDNWSYSSMTTLLRNPLAFKKKYILKVYDDLDSPSAVVGKAAHKALESYYKGKEPSDAIKDGLELINNTSDMGINYGKTGSRANILTTYTQAINFYFEELPVYHEIIGVELEAVAEIETIDGQKLGIPAKSFSDLVVRNKLGEVEVVDHKFVRSYSDGDIDNFGHFIQAMFNYHTLKVKLGEEPKRMIFNECKVSKNKDNTPQIQPYVVEFEGEGAIADFATFYNLYNACTKFINAKDAIFLPNPNDIFDGQATFETFRNGTLGVDRPTSVKHKTEQVQFAEKNYVPSTFDKVGNQDLKDEERIRLKLQEFGISVEMQDTHVGASITQYTFKPSKGIAMSKIAKLANDIAIALKARSVRIEAPIRGTDLVGVEVPSSERKTIELGKQHFKPNTLSIPIGVDVFGTVHYKDLADMPHLLVAGASGCHAKGEKVLMFNGELKNVEDVQVGDVLMGDDSTPRNVIELHRGRYDMVEIIPSRWPSMKVTTNHILSLHNSKTGKITNLTVEEYLIQNNNFKNLNKLYRRPVHFSKSNNQIIPPYILGLWLGDGTNRLSAITTPDEECLEEWEKWGTTLGLKVRREYHNNCFTSYITTGTKASNNGPNNLGRNAAKNALVNLGILNNKHIPQSYLVSSREQRLDLLAGLVDTDGNLDSNGGIDYTTKYRSLAEGIRYLCLSLGLGCSLNVAKKGFTRKDGTKFAGDYYRLHIGGDISIIPNRLGRKHRTTKPVQFYNVRSGFKVQALGEQDYYGFRVDGNHLYMTDNFVVTHNSGKSVMLNVILQALTKQMKPSAMKLILIDPKRVELSQFSGVPHLMQPIVFDSEKATELLKFAVDEMEKRYDILAKSGVRRIEDYGKGMPRIVIVIDEFADLMMTGGTKKQKKAPESIAEMLSPEDMPSAQDYIIRIAQKARAVGIHLVLATQRPSADVVTGLIKANVPTKICFMTTSATNSRIVLDENGAEELLGKGDLLFADPSKAGLTRLQGLYA